MPNRRETTSASGRRELVQRLSRRLREPEVVQALDRGHDREADRASSLPQQLLLVGELDRAVGGPVDGELVAAEDPEAQAEADLRAPVEAEEVGGQVGEAPVPEPAGEAVGQAKGELVLRQAQVRGEGEDVEVGLGRDDVEVLVVDGVRRGRCRGLRDAGRRRRGLGVGRGGAGPGQRREREDEGRAPHWAFSATTSSPFILLCPEPQYSEHSIGKVPARLGHERDPHGLASLGDRHLHRVRLDREAVGGVGGAQPQLHDVALRHLDARGLELVAGRGHLETLRGRRGGRGRSRAQQPENDRRRHDARNSPLQAVASMCPARRGKSRAGGALLAPQRDAATRAARRLRSP